MILFSGSVKLSYQLNNNNEAILHCGKLFFIVWFRSMQRIFSLGLCSVFSRLIRISCQRTVLHMQNRSQLHYSLRKASGITMKPCSNKVSIPVCTEESVLGFAQLRQRPEIKHGDISILDVSFWLLQLLFIYHSSKKIKLPVISKQHHYI